MNWAVWIRVDGTQCQTIDMTVPTRAEDSGGSLIQSFHLNPSWNRSTPVVIRPIPTLLSPLPKIGEKSPLSSTHSSPVQKPSKATLREQMVAQAELATGYRFVDPAILSESLTHASYADNRQQSNERMEFLGDSILSFVICEHLHTTYTDLLEGQMTKIKSLVVSRKSCAQSCIEMGLCSLLFMGKGMTGRKAGSLPMSVSAAVYEAMIAGIYLDGGMEPARKFVLDSMLDRIEEAEASAHQQNFKSVLQQHAQKHLNAHPQYVVLDEKGPDHDKSFEVAVDLDGSRYESGWAKAKKESEQIAALNALMALELAKMDDESGQIVLVDFDPTD